MCLCVLPAEAQHAGGDAGEDEGGRTTEEEDHGVGTDAAETGGRAQHGDPGPAGGGEGQAGGGEVRTTCRQRRASKLVVVRSQPKQQLANKVTDIQTSRGVYRNKILQIKYAHFLF